ncbi:MAG: ribosome-associated translation inhibitor RaiA [Eggerthellaceae bacterium]|nr:ribosome-associated translation inhibitor RaiA [Eggerthellaceae bacterium]
MSITITGRKIQIKPSIKKYAEEKIGNAMKVMKIEPLDAMVVLSVKQNPSIAMPCKCEVTLCTKRHTIRVEESEVDMLSAIDVASAKVLRQFRKYKTKIINKNSHEAGFSRATAKGEALDYDAIMADLSKDDQIVREKEIEYTILTVEEALAKMDLLGHDFYIFIDRDSDEVHLIYKRKSGNYGIIKPKK